MAKLAFLVSLITKDNDYQMEQAASARSAAGELGVDIEIVYADNDAITQSTQLLKAIQADASLRPNAIVVEPLGATPFPKVASAAAALGIGWAVVNREADYTSQLRQAYSSPVFSVSVDQVEIGRIQGKQIAALLPRGGSVLYIQGPSVSSVSRERTEGLRTILPSNVQLVNLRGKWTEESGYQSVCSWMKLMKAQKFRIDLISGQNDVMAMGAKKAVKELANELDRELLSSIPATGCDGVPSTGQAWVRTGQLTATVIVPPSCGKAIALMTRALQMKVQPAEHTFTDPEAFPPLESLRPLPARV
ncbi:MAG TPA: substrate-binding domain-containing protein [Candidatus Acidoferrum sp.]|nr:substrate-binding domain-containing protein [Candidatus Acidoferrum sp.]